MLTITIMKMFNSIRWPFAPFETTTLIIFHLQEEGEISSFEVLIAIVLVMDKVMSK